MRTQPMDATRPVAAVRFRPYLTPHGRCVDLAGPLRRKAKFGVFVLGTSGPGPLAVSAKHPAACVSSRCDRHSVSHPEADLACADVFTCEALVELVTGSADHLVRIIV